MTRFIQVAKNSISGNWEVRVDGKLFAIYKRPADAIEKGQFWLASFRKHNEEAELSVDMRG